MSAYLDVIKRVFNPNYQAWKDDRLAAKDKEFFRPTGTQVYCGKQGSGKTLSAVYHVLKLKQRYPKLIVVTNLELNVPWKDEIKKFQTIDELGKLLVNTNNGKYGVVYLVDEIHTYFNALDSKNIPMYIFTEISQQRKQRKSIIGTSQLFLRMAKPFREQCDNIMICNTTFGLFTSQKAYDGMTLEMDFDGSLIGDKRKTGWFFHTPKVRNAYDTYQKVVSGAEQYESIGGGKLEDKRLRQSKGRR